MRSRNANQLKMQNTERSTILSALRPSVFVRKRVSGQENTWNHFENFRFSTIFSLARPSCLLVPLVHGSVKHVFACLWFDLSIHPTLQLKPWNKLGAMSRAFRISVLNQIFAFPNEWWTGRRRDGLTSPQKLDAVRFPDFCDLAFSKMTFREQLS